MNRLAAAQGQTFDVAIIGGGVVGCGVARDAARRGLRVALFEQSDFGSGTTSASTRIVHGGLRYLETADFRLVRLDLRERETLLRIAPHLVRPLAFSIPFAAVDRVRRLKLRMGLTLYDALAFGSSLPRRRIRSAEASYYDARIDSPERLCIENLLDAAAHGAEVFNYTEVTGALRDGKRITGVRVRDRLSEGEVSIAARITVNASGPWFERVAARVEGAPPGSIRTTKGIHIVCPPVSDRALVLFSAVDGRLLFAIPRLGLTSIGTTDTDYAGDPAEAVATYEDVEYLVASVRGTLPALSAENVLYTTAGVRALVMQPGRASAVSRLHKVVDGERSGTPGLVSIMGAKITGYRAIAEDVTDVACRRLGLAQRATTADEPLPGGRASGEASQGRWPHLNDLYGCRAGELVALASDHPELSQPLSPKYPDIGAQVAHAARYEYCLTVADFIRRRSLLGATADQGRDAVTAVAGLLGRELDWTADHQRREIEAYAHDIERTVSFRAAHSPVRPDRRRD
jgi:glycerol-3-phosphate dehydrogenase